MLVTLAYTREILLLIVGTILAYTAVGGEGRMWID
jgi:hypothetical protein